MKQNIYEPDAMILFREVLKVHKFMLLLVTASAVVEYCIADRELKALNGDGETDLAHLFPIWVNMMCIPDAATIIGCRLITMPSEILV